MKGLKDVQDIEYSTCICLCYQFKFPLSSQPLLKGEYVCY